MMIIWHYTVAEVPLKFLCIGLVWEHILKVFMIMSLWYWQERWMIQKVHGNSNLKATRRGLPDTVFSNLIFTMTGLNQAMLVYQTIVGIDIPTKIHQFSENSGKSNHTQFLIKRTQHSLFCVNELDKSTWPAFGMDVLALLKVMKDFKDVHDMKDIFSNFTAHLCVGAIAWIARTQSSINDIASNKAVGAIHVWWNNSCSTIFGKIRCPINNWEGQICIRCFASTNVRNVWTTDLKNSQYNMYTFFYSRRHFIKWSYTMKLGRGWKFWGTERLWNLEVSREMNPARH